MMHKATFSSCLFHPYKVEKKSLSISVTAFVIARTSRLAYGGGQEVVLHNFIFPPCVHLLHLGAKNTAFQWKYPEYQL